MYCIQYAYGNCGLEMKKNKILIVSDYIFDENPGGCARVSTNLARFFSKKMSVVKILRKAKSCNFRQEIDGIEVYSCGKNPLKIFKAMEKIYKELTCINFHDPYLSLWVVLFLRLKGINLPAFYTFHSPWYQEYEIKVARKKFCPLSSISSFLRKKAERYVLSYCLKIVAESFYMAEKLKEIHGFDCEVFYLGSDTEKFRPMSQTEKNEARKRFSLPLDKKIFFTLRNLEARMGLDNLIKAASIVKQKGIDNFLIVIGGKGSMRKELEDLAVSLKLEKEIRFLGKIDEDMLPMFYGSCDAFILPTAFLEGFGLVSAEAMSCAIAVLATPVGANKEVVGALDSSLLFETKEPESIANGILSFMSRKDILHLSQKAVSLARRKFSFEIYAQKNMDLIFSILNLK